MIHDNLLLYGFSELVKVDGREGYCLQRIPSDVKDGLRERAQIKSQMPAGNEIRFVPLEDTVTIKLVSYEEDAIACVYYGDFQDRIYHIGTDPVELKITIPETINKYVKINGEYVYHPKLIRIMLSHGSIHLIDVTGKRRPPFKDEMPCKTMLSYGTSITHGYSASLPSLSYAKLTARKLNMDHINLGFSGSAYCERSIADHIAKRNDWDLLTLCISVNMLNQGFTLEEFYDRASYMIKTIVENHPNKKIVCISPFRYHEDANITLDELNIVSKGKEYRDVLKCIVTDMKNSNLLYLDGMELLSSYGGLTSDLLHPGDYGMISIVEKLVYHINNTWKL
ncbi:hypothetical protein SH2C18_26860 [Clostridium sediminicola]|uniref:SGNH/GDSL hydrolase family protein n=1 Tax=Clostridium sediminicola TaxID=3114879 RepID=UPI0031F2277F